VALATEVTPPRPAQRADLLPPFSERAVWSAPPHPRAARRGAHSNPLSSLFIAAGDQQRGCLCKAAGKREFASGSGARLAALPHAPASRRRKTVPGAMSALRRHRRQEQLLDSTAAAGAVQGADTAGALPSELAATAGLVPQEGKRQVKRVRFNSNGGLDSGSDGVREMDRASDATGKGSGGGRPSLPGLGAAPSWHAPGAAPALIHRSSGGADEHTAAGSAGDEAAVACLGELQREAIARGLGELVPSLIAREDLRRARTLGQVRPHFPWPCQSREGPQAGARPREPLLAGSVWRTPHLNWHAHACQWRCALAQINRKAVVAVCGGVVVALDQHAADERVQLEALQAQLAQERAARPAEPPPASTAAHQVSGDLLQQLALRPGQVGAWMALGSACLKPALQPQPGNDCWSRGVPTDCRG
jgi:hypothetical protein